jgi:UDP-glucose 4-epimerase
MTQPYQSVLITGVTGFIGRYVARHFSGQGWSVIGVDNSPPENAPLANLASYHRIQLPDSSLNDVLKTHAPDICIHCAGRASVGLSVTDPDADFYANTALTFKILNSLRLYSPQCRFIFLSSAAVYGDPESLPISETQLTAPLSPYGFHKLYGEQLCLEFAKIHGISTASVRIFSAYGPGLRRQVVWDICQKVITQPIVKLQGTGAESRDFIHALDIARALMVIASSAPMQGEVYNLGSGREITIIQLANMIINSSEHHRQVEFDGVVPIGNPLNWQADISKLDNLGFNVSVPLEQGIKTFFNWCQAELIGV